MSAINLEEKKIRGFAGIIAKSLAPLNENEKFKKKFSGTNLQFLLNAVNVNFAALIIIDSGKLKVESIPNKPKENLKKKIIGWDAYLEMDTQTFLAVSMKRITIIGLGKKILTRKVKIKGIRKLIILLKVFSLLN